MPTYDYVCSACEARVEYFQSMTEKPKRTCPKCGARKLVRQIGGGAGILFKGSGFYQTDYRSESYKQGADKEKPPETSHEPKPEPKPDHKPDHTPAAKPADATPSSKPDATPRSPSKPAKPSKKPSR